ncbi:MAG: anti-sigma factor domain-containing protein [Gemmatimonadaceae bacterium]
MMDDIDATPEDREPLDAVARAALTPDTVRLATRERLLARARADGRASGLTRASATATSARRMHRSVVAMTGMALALAASLALVVRTELVRRTERAGLIAQTETLARRLDSLGIVVRNRDKLLASLTGGRVKLVRLASAQTATPRALMFWNQATNGWTFIAHNLAPLRAGRTYQLWLVTAREKISAGTFSVTADGDAVVQATYALDRNALTAVAVTEEPAGGVPQPTGAMVVVGVASTL